MEPLVTTEWLAEHLPDTNLAIVDCSWHMPADGRSGRAEFADAHIPGAVFLDIDEVSDSSHPAPHMLPTPEQFADAMANLGIERSDRVVVYDNSPYRTAARGWFMLRHFGVSRVAILDGGLQKWLAEGRPFGQGAPRLRPSAFDAVERDDVVTKAQILGRPGGSIIDARGRPRFEGSVPEPRPHLASGHIPGSRNLPYSALYNEDGTFKSREEIARLFTDAGVDPNQPFIATCGSGVTANSLIFAARLLGNDSPRLYDGSWSEWGADPATPKATGPA